MGDHHGKAIYEIPDSEDEDEYEKDLQLAIRLSLTGSTASTHNHATSSTSGTASPAPTKRKIQIDLTGSDEEGAAAPSKLRKIAHEPANAKAPGFTRMDRKEMEKERLERQRRMLPNPSTPGKTTSGTNAKAPANTVTPGMFYSGARKYSSNGSTTKPAGGSASAKTPGVQYHQGVVKRTAAEGFPRAPDDITIEEEGDELLEHAVPKAKKYQETLTTAVISAFMWDDEWIMKRLPLHKKDLDLHFVMHAKEQHQRIDKEETYLGLPKVTLCFPDMSGQINCMHSKLMMLFHRRGDEEWLRIVIPTANLTEYDWGGLHGIMENMVFIIDLPRFPKSHSETKQTPFLDDLLYFCTAQGIQDTVLEQLFRYDFTPTAPMAFVHSIGGSHAGKSWKKTGYCGLGTAIKRLGMASRKGLVVDYVTSSLGATNEQFISNMYRAAMGDNGLLELEGRSTTKPKKNKKAQNDDSTDSDSAPEGDRETDWNQIRPRFSVYFPSKETVESSRGGKDAGGTICFQSQWWNRPEFPKTIIKDTKSVRNGLLMHNKLLFARPSHRLESKAGNFDAWAYVGSANLSESAWGKLVKGPKLNCKNWECGVIIPVRSKEAGRTLSGQGVPRSYPQTLDVFKGVVPVPMHTPGETMQEKTPWFFMDELVLPPR